MNNTKYFLGVDGGGSKTTAVVFNEKGEFIGKACGESINYYSVGIDNARKSMADIVNLLPVKEFECAVIGMSALAERATEEETERFCGGIIKSNKIIMDSDLFVALETMQTEGECAVVISGTGSMAVCRNADKSISHAGGFGYILGDEGSGYSIGITAIKTAIRAAENCIPATMLTDKCLEYFSVNNIYDLIDLFYEKTVSRKTVAAFAKEVMLCAESGDKAALEIINTEAKLLSQTTLSLLKGKNPATPVGLWGGVFQHNSIFRDAFINHLSESNFNDVKLLDFTPETGAIMCCYRNSGIKIVDIIKDSIKNTYNI